MGRYFVERSHGENIFWAVVCFVAAAIQAAAGALDNWRPGAVLFGLTALLAVKLGFGYLADAKRVSR